MRLWPWSKRFTLRFSPGESKAELDRKLGELAAADKITRFQSSFVNEGADDAPVEYPNEDQAWAVYQDESQNAVVRAIAFFYCMHVRMNAERTQQTFRGLGKFGNVDVHFVIKTPGYKGEGWRRKLAGALERLRLIEEQI